ncbi:2-octaprenyl-3-methyl-6-methoxy-1,4-benzoquinol hydroxylase [Halioglobus sp. HI00S01]|uniref:UbiH/UbiF/VisC/COQ6 family ubiquinone biosynthesis hydroxylase n=1 Tax=Halioglobus sp. HI00S01 TaxID=1822214 RepID=UPI0007C3D0B4|nr:UbiH/UbiF/VisC/COQ6 family ubiquinone biosynthesis hydroxylase [Halioglobus sp. HI00S01]KZX56112.1 2-octaprenyl-3-methyl-6-methoxy-1,4-benzoquinol hydroxylase [Halioglobus sp. HI00S01]
MNAQHYDVVIVGAGIAGSAMALALSGSGYRIALIEPQPLARRDLPVDAGVHNFDARVSALTPHSARFLESLDAWAGVVGYRSCAYRHMTVWDAEGTGRIEFDAAELDVPALGHIVENRAIVDALLAKLHEAPDIHCLSPERVEACERLDDGRMSVRLESGAELEAELVVGADGAMSRIRELMAYTTREWDYGHRAIVATVALAESHQDTAWQRFLPTGPLALLPLPDRDDQHLCSIVWSLEEDLVDPLLALDDDAFCQELSAAFEQQLGGITAVSARFAFPLRQRHAVDYVQPGVALVADAAHTIHPLAGQGINLGLLDVEALAKELLRARAAGLSPGAQVVLARYQRQRKGENLLMMSAMDGFKRLFGERALPVRWLRNAGMRSVGAMAPLKRRLMRHAMGIGP